MVLYKFLNKTLDFRIPTSDFWSSGPDVSNWILVKWRDFLLIYLDNQAANKSLDLDLSCRSEEEEVTIFHFMCQCPVFVTKKLYFGLIVVLHDDICT